MRCVMALVCVSVTMAGEMGAVMVMADLARALSYFQEATAADGSYALAHAGLALTYAVLPYYTDFPPERAIEDGYAAASRALALNAQLAEAHAAVGQIAQGLEWNLGAAEVAYRRAIEFQPSYATAHQWYAETLLLMGRLAAARSEIERAVTLDPMSVSARYVRAYILAVERSQPAARQEFMRLVADNPGYRFGQAGLVLLPGSLVLALSFPLAGRAADQCDRRVIMLCALSIFASSSYLFTFLSLEWPLSWIVWLVVLRFSWKTWARPGQSLYPTQERLVVKRRSSRRPCPWSTMVHVVMVSVRATGSWNTRRISCGNWGWLPFTIIT
jgi:tetratricopeptide (TPR) repeat protein